ncbi:MAG: DUF3592 domain-containing protein [Chlamydiota bacterium]
MYKNPVWVIFLTVMSLVAVAFMGFAGYKILKYRSYSTCALPTSVEWSVKAISHSKYLVKADFDYIVEGQKYHGKTVLRNKIFINPSAAEQALEEYRGQCWTVWYNPRKPQQATINRRFPLKVTIYAGILGLMLIYFIGLGIYVKKLSSG